MYKIFLFMLSHERITEYILAGIAAAALALIIADIFIAAYFLLYLVALGVGMLFAISYYRRHDKETADKKNRTKAKTK